VRGHLGVSRQEGRTGRDVPSVQARVRSRVSLGRVRIWPSFISRVARTSSPRKISRIRGLVTEETKTRTQGSGMEGEISVIRPRAIWKGMGRGG
jgi:hypothetical protein